MIKKAIPIIIGLFVLFICFMFYIVTVSETDTAIARLQADVSEIQNRINIIQIDGDSVETEIIQDATGLNQDRVNRDNEIFEEFISYILTWNTWEQYMSIRSTVVIEYDLDYDGEFLTVFMPYVPNAISGDVNYNRIDTMGLNMSYDRFESMPIGISLGVYDYIAWVTIRSENNHGHSATNTVVAMYSVDVDGNLLNISAIPVPN